VRRDELDRGSLALLVPESQERFDPADEFGSDLVGLAFAEQGFQLVESALAKFDFSKQK
jgi:hypothetical protein